jgi:hypothetical protein
MNQSRSYKTLESRSVTALQLKVLSHQATGWLLDGPALEVTDFAKGKRAITRHSQAMFKPGFSAMHWGLLQ